MATAWWVAGVREVQRGSSTYHGHHSSKIPSWMVERMPKHEDGHPGVLDAGLNRDGNDILPLPVAELGEQASKAEPKPWKGKADQGSSPGDQFQHEELGPDAADQYEYDEEERKGLHEPHHKVGRLGQALPDGDANEEGDNQKNCILSDGEIGDVTDMGASNDDLTEKENPEGHHKERRECGHSCHCDRQVEVATKHDRPDVGGSPAWGGSREEEAQPHLWVVKDEAKGK